MDALAVELNGFNDPPPVVSLGLLGGKPGRSEALGNGKSVEVEVGCFGWRCFLGGGV